MAASDSPHMSVVELQTQALIVDTSRRAIFAWSSEMCGWQGTKHLRSYFTGNISFIITGTNPKNYKV